MSLSIGISLADTCLPLNLNEAQADMVQIMVSLACPKELKSGQKH